MRYFAKGFFLGLSLVLVNKICCYLFAEFSETAIAIFSGIVFFAVTTAFLISKHIPGLLACGFCGFFVMFFGEIAVIEMNSHYPLYHFLVVYIGGFFGSMAAIPTAIILTIRKKSQKEVFPMTQPYPNRLKGMLLLYALISAVGFSYLVMPQNSGLGVLIFGLLQFICLWFIVPSKKQLILFFPILIFCLNAFISANTIWRAPNLILSAFLYAGMFTKFHWQCDSISDIRNVLVYVAKSVANIPLPGKWLLQMSDKNAPIIKRILLGLLLAIPCALLLTVVLANADMVFSAKTGQFFESVFTLFHARTIFILIAGIIVGLYLFGVLAQAYQPGISAQTESRVRRGDFIIISILLGMILTVYTLFVIVQFRYLFARGALPDGLSYTEYARKGFFELFFLTGINLFIILCVVRLTRHASGKKGICIKLFCHYLCAVTVVLLISSFYRMWLYTNDDGLTRLRFFVMGFLAFELIGLLATFFYIAKPKFNITLIYLTIALSYYTILNIVPTDYLIAKNQIDRYSKHERDDVNYVFTLSADAAPAMVYLAEQTTDEGVREMVEHVLKERSSSNIPNRWQRYNLSIQKAKKLINENEAVAK